MSGNYPEYSLTNLTWMIAKSEDLLSGQFPVKAVSGSVSPLLRESLMNWVLELAQEYSLPLNTGLLACIYLDKFFSIKSTPNLSFVELIGFTALSLASKFKSSLPFSLSMVESLFGSKCPMDALCTMELYILSVIQWDLDLITPTELADALVNNMLNYDFSALSNTIHSYASLCYTDIELASTGNYNIAIASITLALKEHNIEEISTAWVRVTEDYNLVDSEKLKVVCEKLESKFLKVSN